MHCLRTSLARAAHDAIVMEVEVEDSADRRRVQLYGRQLTAQHSDEAKEQ